MQDQPGDRRGGGANLQRFAYGCAPPYDPPVPAPRAETPALTPSARTSTPAPTWRTDHLRTSFNAPSSSGVAGAPHFTSPSLAAGSPWLDEAPLFPGAAGPVADGRGGDAAGGAAADVFGGHDFPDPFAGETFARDLFATDSPFAAAFPRDVFTEDGLRLAPDIRPQSLRAASPFRFTMARGRSPLQFSLNRLPSPEPVFAPSQQLLSRESPLDLRGAFPLSDLQFPAFDSFERRCAPYVSLVADPFAPLSPPHPRRHPHLNPPQPLPAAELLSEALPPPLSPVRAAAHANARPPPHRLDSSKGSDDYFGDGDDDDWVQHAVAEAEKIEGSDAAARTPSVVPSRVDFEPPRTISPFFTGTSGSDPEHARLRPRTHKRPEPPRRPPTTAGVSFPKRPLSRPASAASSGRATPAQRPRAARPAQSPQHAPSRIPGRMTPVGHGGAREPVRRGETADTADLVSVHALDTAQERLLFRFQHFNRMQSAVFQAAYHAPDNLVLSAPTGSGKTTVFELALLNMIKEKTLAYAPLAIYMAPTKALCWERAHDWRERFRLIGLHCIELTGDTEMSSAIFRHLESIDLIVTTPEKWDSMTRRLSMGKVIDRLRLMMIDEVHMLSESRGATLEVVVSRMKTRGDRVRFVAVSASIPNIDDIARWIGSSSELVNGDGDGPLAHMPQAKVFKFGDEYRPVPLKRFTYGFDAPNDFALGSKLDRELFPLLNRHSDGLPVLVFCPTRKACHQTAEHVLKSYRAAFDAKQPLPWDTAQNKTVILKDPKVQALTDCGIAVHHAGLDLLDRRAIEQAFKNSELHMIVATSTLAVGVNMPAHLVVIKGTVAWEGQGFREYTDIDIQQMMGRAGRPQFDTSGTVVVMCQRSKVAQYRDILGCRMTLESCLHENLTEHINSEIGLQTITSLKTAQEWLRGTFLFIRIQQNPRHYMGALVKDRAHTWTEALDRYAEDAVKALEEHELVACDEVEDPEEVRKKEGLHTTSLGKIMSQSVISYKTMCHIITMEPDSDLRALLEILSGSDEFASLRIRQGESPILNKLRVCDEVRFHVDESVKTYADKVFLLLQATFGNVDLAQFATKSENASPFQTQMAIFQAAPRVARAILHVASEKKYGGATRSALQLLRTINGKAWEDSPTIFRQLEKIGPKSITVLGSNGVHSWDEFIEVDPGRLEMWLNRNPPFGYQMIAAAKELPRFHLSLGQEEVVTAGAEFPVLKLRVTISHTGQLVRKSKTPQGKPKAGQSYTFIALFLSSKGNRFLDLRKIDTRKLNDCTNEFVVDVELHDPGEKIIAIAGVEEKAGLSRTFEFKPRVAASHFKARPTRPAAAPGKSVPGPSCHLEKPAVPVASATAVRKRTQRPPASPPQTSDPLEPDIISLASTDDEQIDLTSKSKKRPDPSGPISSPKRARLAPPASPPTSAPGWATAENAASAKPGLPTELAAGRVPSGSGQPTTEAATEQALDSMTDWDSYLATPQTTSSQAPPRFPRAATSSPIIFLKSSQSPRGGAGASSTAHGPPPRPPGKTSPQTRQPAVALAYPTPAATSSAAPVAQSSPGTHTPTARYGLQSTLFMPGSDCSPQPDERAPPAVTEPPGCPEPAGHVLTQDFDEWIECLLDG